MGYIAREVAISHYAEHNIKALQAYVKTHSSSDIIKHLINARVIENVALSTHDVCKEFPAYEVCKELSNVPYGSTIYTGFRYVKLEKSERSEDNIYLDLYCLFKRSWAGRDMLVSVFSWAVPTESALNAIKVFTDGMVMEIGAGTGYWAYLLRNRGCNVVCCDIKGNERTWSDAVRSNNPIYTWTNVLCMDGRKLVETYKNRTLMLCWPHTAELYGYKGKKVVYVGEYSGCTGDLMETYKSKIEKYEVISIPQYYGLYDALYLVTFK